MNLHEIDSYQPVEFDTWHSTEVIKLGYWDGLCRSILNIYWYRIEMVDVETLANMLEYWGIPLRFLLPLSCWVFSSGIFGCRLYVCGFA